LREMLRNPDQWKQCREYADGISLFIGSLNKCSDDDLRMFFAAINEMNLTLELDSWAVKQFEPVGSKQFRAQKRMFDRYIACGAKIHTIYLDEPLNGAEKVGKDLAYCVKETADFIELLRKEYPDVLIGDTEAYPHFEADVLIKWINDLQAELKRRNVRGLDFFRLDINWSIFGREVKESIFGKELKINPEPRTGSWQDVVRIERHCRNINLPTSTIFWAANQGTLKRYGLVDEKTWYIGVMRMGDDYFEYGGKPDQLVFQSWIAIPTEILPETKPFTFTNSFIDFCEKFLNYERP